MSSSDPSKYEKGESKDTVAFLRQQDLKDLDIIEDNVVKWWLSGDENVIRSAISPEATNNGQAISFMEVDFDIKANLKGLLSQIYDEYSVWQKLHPLWKAVMADDLVSRCLYFPCSSPY
jgi:hypothetical protein